MYFLDFNKKCQNLIIHVDLALCTGGLLAHEGLIGRPLRRAPGPPLGVKTPLPPFLDPPGPQEAPGSPQGVPRDHTDPYGSIRIHTDTSQVNFQYVFVHILDILGKVCQKNVEVQTNQLFK